MRERVSRTSTAKGLSAEQQHDLRNGLLDNADRTFLWISLVLDMIEDTPSTSKRALNNMLSTIPPKLEDVYEKVLSHIASGDVAPTRKVMYIMLAATEPLGVEEMNSAFSISDEETSWQQIDFEASIVDYVKHILPRLVKVIDSKFYFVHHTVKEFLSGPLQVQSNLLQWKHTLSPLEANYVLATSCIKYLMLSDFQRKANPYADRRSPPPELGWIDSEDDEHGEVCEVIESQGILPSSRAQTMSAAATEIELEPTLSQSSSGSECRDLVALTDWIRGQALHAPVDEGDSRADEHEDLGGVTESQSSLPGGGTQKTATDAEHIDLDPTSSQNSSIAETEESSIGFDEPRYWMRIQDLSESRQTLFLIYAARYWSIHFLAAQATDFEPMEELKPSALTLCDPNSQHFYAWYLVWQFRESFDPFNSPSTRGLHLAAYLGLSMVLPLIIEQGVDLHVKDDHGNTALYAVTLAAAKGRPWKDVLKWLLDHKLDPEAQNHEGSTALHVGIYRSEFDQQVGIVRQILESNPNLDVVDYRGLTLLHCAAIKGHIEIVQLLLERGSTVDLTDRADQTPLFYAVYRGHLHIVRMLLDAGADKEKQNHFGITPLVEGLRIYLQRVGEGHVAHIQSSIELIVRYQAIMPRELIQDFEDEAGHTLQSNTELLSWLFGTARRPRLPHFRDFFGAKGWVDLTL